MQIFSGSQQTDFNFSYFAAILTINYSQKGGKLTVVQLQKYIFLVSSTQKVKLCLYKDVDVNEEIY